MDFLYANSKFAVQNEGTYLPRILRETCSQFHQPYTRAFFVRIFQQSQNITRKTTFVRKTRTYNVDDIDTCIDRVTPKLLIHVKSDQK